MIKIGTIVGTFGIKGEIKIYPLTNMIEIFLDLKELRLGDEPDAKTIHLIDGRIHKNLVVARVKEIQTIEDAGPFLNRDLYIDEDLMPPLAEGESYVYELLGLEVYSDEGSFLGLVEDVFESGAHSVYVISDNGKEILLPAIPEVILRKDLKERKLVVHILPGLLD